MAVNNSFLKSVAYFPGLSTEELDSVKKLIFEKKVERGDIIVFEGDPPEALYFVSSGVVKMFRTSAEGKEQVLNIVRPGESFNDVPAFDGGLNLASAQAMGPVTLYGIPKHSLDLFLQEHPQVAVSVANVLAAQVRHLVSLVEDLSFRPVVGRVAKVLLEYAGDGTSPGQQLTQQDMAAMAGTAREVVSRSLKVLQSEGVIEIDRHRIVITDKEALRGIAGASN
ncbi:MAG TPA: Crp/Fnr family transcriptional regulator [Dehalococcoidia bacterium]|nr:Crp/Fnr family transcriptional regulator [Dehalococcoidia bacterium]